MSRRPSDGEGSRDWDQGGRVEQGHDRSSASSLTSSFHRPRHIHRDDELEAGQVRTECSPGRDQRVTQYSEEQTSRRSAINSTSRPRSREGSPALGTDKDVRAALEVFSKAMHATLLSTSTHALAAQHLRRMESFPHDSSGSTIKSVEAQNRLRDAEVELAQRARDLHGAFEKLMKHTLSLVTDNDRDRSRNENRERGRIRIRAEADEASEPQKTTIWDREMDGVQSPSRKGKEKAISSNPEEEGKTGKRSRARLLLEDIVKRLEVVEGLKDNLDDRCTDLEDLVNAKIQDEMEIARVGNMKWRVVEELRDPDGVIRCLKRKRRMDRDEFMMDPESQNMITPSCPVDIPPHFPLATGSTDAIIQLQRQVAAMENDRSGIAKLKESVESLLSDRTNMRLGHSPTASTEPKPNSENVALQQQVDSLRAEITAMKQYRMYRDQTLIDAIKRDMERYCSEIVVNQILNSVGATSNQSKPSNSKPNARTSPSIGASARLPSVLQGAVLPTVPQTPIRESSAPPKPSVERTSRGGSAPLHSDAPLPQNGSAGLPSHTRERSDGDGDNTIRPIQSSRPPRNVISRSQQGLPEMPAITMSTSSRVNSHLLPDQSDLRTASTSQSIHRLSQQQHQSTNSVPHHSLQIRPFHFKRGQPGYSLSRQTSGSDHTVPLDSQDPKLSQWTSHYLQHGTPPLQPDSQDIMNSDFNHNPSNQSVQTPQHAAQHRHEPTQLPSESLQLPGLKSPSQPAGGGS